MCAPQTATQLLQSKTQQTHSRVVAAVIIFNRTWVAMAMISPKDGIEPMGNAMLLNEFLKEHRKVRELETTVVQQRKDF